MKKINKLIFLLLIITIMVSGGCRKKVVTEDITINPADSGVTTVQEVSNTTAVLHTTEGDITIQLNTQSTPMTANNFILLSQRKFYNNTIFHRVINGFMIQGGDPTGTGSGGPGYTFEDEPFEGEYTRGTVAMANAGPDTNGSQFFIMHQNYSLPKDYVIFGKVIDGIDVVDKIAEAEVKMNDLGEESAPVKPSKIKSVDIVTKE
jgi:peptidylprolyl isomerase